MSGVGLRLEDLAEGGELRITDLAAVILFRWLLSLHGTAAPATPRAGDDCPEEKGCIDLGRIYPGGVCFCVYECDGGSSLLLKACK